MLRVTKGALVPADRYTVERLREKNYSTGTVLSATLAKPRSPRFHRFAHALGRLAVDNIPALSNLTAHQALKRLQVEAGIACDEQALTLDDGHEVLARIPESLSFSAMDEGEFREVVRAICRHITKRYWPELTPEEIEELAEMIVDD